MIRVATDRDFTYLNEDITRLKQQLKDGFISLNKTKRLAEKKADTDRAAARKKERSARGLPDYTFTEIAVSATNAVASAAAPRTAHPAAASAKPAAHDPNNPDAADEESDSKEPAADPILKESLSILRDLIALSPTPSGPAVAATPPPK
jgi:hypothetical protein